MGKRSKGPNIDAMSDEEKRKYVIEEIINDILRGDRYALTRVCEMWTREEVEKLFPALKDTSKGFIKNLWEKWEQPAWPA